jgi:hypothetical protein
MGNRSIFLYRRAVRCGDGGVRKRLLADEGRDTLLPRKATKLQLLTTVPQTDTGARDEYSKALERTLEKELGKLTP